MRGELTSHQDQAVLPSEGQMNAMHSLYCALHRVQNDLPQATTYRTRVMTDIFGGQPWSWHVIGVTRQALKQLSENDFRYQKGIVRAHLRPRQEIYHDLLNAPEPCSCQDLFQYLLREDKTVLATKQENATLHGLPEDYHRLANGDYTLFPSRFVGWRHSTIERDALRELHSTVNSSQRSV